MATKTAATPEVKQVQIPQLVIANLEVELIGTARLVTHRFAFKAMQQMLDDHMGVAAIGRKKGREVKDPIKDFIGGLHLLHGIVPTVKGEFKSSDLEALILAAQDEEGGTSGVYAEGRFGMPSIALKAAIVRAGTDSGLNMTDLRRQIHIDGEFMEINCKPGPAMRCDIVRVSNGAPDIRFRPDFTNWTITTVIRYNKAARTRDEIINLIRMAGFGVGLGEWRPGGKTSSGTWGTFKLGKMVQLSDETE